MKGSPHQCAVVFADNSGMDIILGIFPFARELLNRGTNVSILDLLEFTMRIITRKREKNASTLALKPTGRVNLSPKQRIPAAPQSGDLSPQKKN